MGAICLEKLTAPSDFGLSGLPASWANGDGRKHKQQQPGEEGRSHGSATPNYRLGKEANQPVQTRNRFAKWGGQFRTPTTARRDVQYGRDDRAVQALLPGRKPRKELSRREEIGGSWFAPRNWPPNAGAGMLTPRGLLAMANLGTHATFFSSDFPPAFTRFLRSHAVPPNRIGGGSIVYTQLQRASPV